MMMSGLSSWCCLFRGFFLDVFCWDGSALGASRRVFDRRERSRQPVGNEVGVALDDGSASTPTWREEVTVTEWQMATVVGIGQHQPPTSTALSA